ncbi:MAG TPA: DUF459 domain-containing protein [Acidimicrobiia bacterium]|nr:DUF459 domain-containing protein [Acidimicrobiia bacterium]
MPSDDTTPNASRREQRSRRRRIWRRSLIVGVAVVVLAAGTAYAVTGPLQHDDRGGHRVSRSVPTTAPVAGTAAAQTCRAPLNPDDPLRLWIGGDSLAGSLGPSLGRRAGSTGVVQPVFDSRVSSGLLSPDFVNWPQHGADDMSLYNPEVTVFIVGANDAQNLPEGATRDPGWRAQYSALVEEMLTVIGGNGRAVYWVGAPVMADATYSERVQGVNDVFREVAAKHPDVTYVDAYTLFSAPDGTYASMLPVPGGKVARVRGADGIHLTPEGGDLLAETVFERLDATCRITQQAVPGAVKATIEAPGSSSVPGSRRDAPTATTRSTTGSSRR